MPALQNHCHVLATSVRVKAAREFVTRLDHFLVSILKYLSQNGTVQMTEQERAKLQARWSTRKYYDADLLRKCVTVPRTSSNILTVYNSYKGADRPESGLLLT